MSSAPEMLLPEKNSHERPSKEEKKPGTERNERKSTPRWPAHYTWPDRISVSAFSERQPLETRAVSATELASESVR
jgi:hypothetical protein